jgi:hypothetical protein
MKTSGVKLGTPNLLGLTDRGISKLGKERGGSLKTLQHLDDRKAYGGQL